MGMISIQQLPEVLFDVENEEHLLAGSMVLFGDRQHPTLRFVLELPHGSIPQMIQTKMAERLAMQVLGDRFPGKGKETYETLSNPNCSTPAVIRKPQLRQVAAG